MFFPPKATLLNEGGLWCVPGGRTPSVAKISYLTGGDAVICILAPSSRPYLPSVIFSDLLSSVGPPLSQLSCSSSTRALLLCDHVTTFVVRSVSARKPSPSPLPHCLHAPLDKESHCHVSALDCAESHSCRCPTPPAIVALDLADP